MDSNKGKEIMTTLVRKEYSSDSNTSKNKKVRLSNYVDIRGRSYKIPQDAMSKILECLQLKNYRGLSSDCSFIPISREYLVMTTNSMYSVIDDPFSLGEIACAKILSNFYTSGTTQCDLIMMTLAYSMAMPQERKMFVITEIIKGFKNCAEQCGAKVVMGAMFINPWCFVGGTALGICKMDDCIMPYEADVGDVLILTKPLGTQVAINVNSWAYNADKWRMIKDVIGKDDVIQSYSIALASMRRVNKIAAECMKKYFVQGVADVGSNGLLSAAKQLVKKMRKRVSFVIYNLPIIDKLAVISRACGTMFRLENGECPETSGGLLICMATDQAAAYIQDLRSFDQQGWVIGTVEKGQERTAVLTDQPYIIDVDLKMLYGDIDRLPSSL